MTSPSKYRYPGAKPFQTEEKHIFHGREQDTKELLRLLRLEQLVVLYAKSGLGKSSLINAGLVPQITESGEFELFSIRFGAYKEGKKSPSPLESTLNVVNNQSALLDKIRPEDDNSLWYHLKSCQMKQSGERPLLLIFDQFEELFAYPEATVEEFAMQLSEALYTSIPQRYREQRQRGFKKKDDFLSPEEMTRLDQPLRLHLLLAIRSDRMSLLKELKDYLPTILSRDYKLEALRIEEAEDAILNPAYQKNGFITPVFDYEDDAIERLLNHLSKDRKKPIESFQLQILCEYVERQIVERKGRTLICASDLQNLDAILEDYYFNKINTLDEKTERPAARRLIEEGLILEEEERRLTLYEGQILRSYGISYELLHRLLDTHLLRAEPSLRGGYTYELSHDTLVPPILKAKKERLEKEQAQKDAEDKKRQAQLLEDEKRKRRHAGWVAIGMAVLAIIAVGMAIWAFSILTDLQQEKNRRMGLQRREWKETAEIFQEAGFVADAQKIEEYIKQSPLPEDSVIRSNLTPFETILAEASKVDDTLYRQAIQMYNAAQQRDPTRAKEVESLVLEVFDNINNLWREAEAAKETALAAQRGEEMATKRVFRVKSELDKTILELEKLSSRKEQRYSLEKKADPSLNDLTPSDIKLTIGKYDKLIRDYMDQGQFVKAEEILKKLRSDHPESKSLKRYIPHMLFFQKNTTDAKKKYLEYKSEPFPTPEKTFAEIFLSDLSAFEAQGLIPEDLKAEVAEIRRLLEQ